MTTTIVNSDTAIIDGIGKPFYRGGVPRFFDGCLCGFGCFNAIENIRRYTPIKGIVVRQVGADAEPITHVVRNTPLHTRAISISKVTFLIVVTNGGLELRRNAVAHIDTVGV